MKSFLFILTFLFSLTSLNAQWTEIDIGSNEMLQDLCYALNNDDYIFVAGGSDVYKSTDAGLTWTNINPGYTTSIWGVSFPTTSIGFVCSTDGYILKTEDGGNSWDISLDLVSGGFDRIVFKDANNGIASGSQTYVTSDGGENWTVSLSSGYWALDHAQGDTYWAASQVKVAKSTDNGNTWIPLINDTESLFGAVDFYDADHGIIGDAGFIRITNDGFTFDEYASPGIGINRAAVRMDYDTCYISGEDGLIFKSTDAGVNWTQDGAFPDDYFRAMIHTPEDVLIACGQDGILVRKEYADPEPNPAISVEPTELAFDTIPVGDTTAKMLTVTNSGGKILMIDSLVFDNDAFWTDQEPFDLEGDESKSFEVYFTALDQGDTTGWLRIYNNTVFTGVKKVHLHGYGGRFVGLDNFSEEESFEVFPNPSSGLIQVNLLDFDETQIQLTIHSVSGTECLRKNLESLISTYQLDLSHLSPGLYFISVSNENKRKSQRLIIR